MLLFNEGAKPLEVKLQNRHLRPGQTAVVWESSARINNPATMAVTVLPDDVALVHVR